MSDIYTKLDNGSLPDMQGGKIGTLIKGSPIAIQVAITAAANSTAKSVSIPYDFELIDVIVQARATSSGGTVTVRKGTTAITNAIVMATDTNIARAGTIDDAQSTILTTESINLLTAGANDRGVVTLIGIRN